MTKKPQSLAESLSQIADSPPGGRFGRDRGTTPPDAAAAGYQMKLTSAYADVVTGAMESPIVSVSDWDGVLRHFGLDPNEFEVLDDTVQMSRWQQSKRTETGDRDMVWLHSYKARFRRITGRVPQVDLDKVRKDIARWRPIRRTPGKGLGQPSTLYVGWADWQLGKGDGGGVEGTTQRVLDSIEQTTRRLAELRRVGRNVTSMAVWNMGDPTEGCNENYAAQLHTIQLNRRQQLNLALQLWLTGLRAFAPLVDDLEFGSVICNHGEWTRPAPGARPVTGDSDNIGGYLGDTVKSVLTGRAGFDHLRFAIPHDEMTMLSIIQGVPVALAHGHKAPTGSTQEVNWLRGQSLRIVREQHVEPRLWMTAHRHHYQITDFGPWTRFQHPSLDYGSKWYTDTSGHWSTPGTFTCLIGQHPEAGGELSSHMATGFSDETVLRPAS